jgi:hypothetical protein
MKITDDILSNEIDATEKAIELEKLKTELKKAEFIREIKKIGGEIKANPSTVRFIKKPWYLRLKIFLAKIFTKF